MDMDNIHALARTRQPGLRTVEQWSVSLHRRRLLVAIVRWSLRCPDSVFHRYPLHCRHCVRLLREECVAERGGPLKLCFPSLRCHDL